MPFKIVRNDITKMNTDAVVNTANGEPVYGSGTDFAIYKTAGEKKLLSARKKIGRIETGKAAVTKAYALEAKYIIHTVGPVWQGGSENEEELLRNCYQNSLAIAKKKRCKSIAFPLIATGNDGFPKDLAIRIALAEFASFLMKNEMVIYLVVFDKEAFSLSGKLFEGVDEFIDAYYVEEKKKEEYFNERPQRVADDLTGKRSEGFFSTDKLTDERSGVLLGSRSDSDKAYEMRILEMSEKTLMEKMTLEKPLIKKWMSQKSISKESIPANVMSEKTVADFELADNETSEKVAILIPNEMSEKNAILILDETSEKTAIPIPDEMSKKTVVLIPDKIHENIQQPQNKSVNIYENKPARTLDDVMQEIGETFQERLLRLIDLRQMTNAQVYKKANLDRKHFSKILCNPSYKPKKRTVLAFAIALELSLDETKDLLARAEYALSPSSKFDLIIQYFIERKVYDVYVINMALFEHDQQMLGE